MTVDEALRRLESDDVLPNVHLRDLVAHCGSATAAGPRAYLVGSGRSDSKTRSNSKTRVIIPVEPNRNCEAFVAAATGSARRARPTIVAKLVQRDALDASEPAFELHPHGSSFWMLAMALVLLGVGSYGLRSGLRPAPTHVPLPRTAVRKPAADLPGPTDGLDPFRVSPSEDGLLSRPLRPREAWFRQVRRTNLLVSALAGALLFSSVAWVASVTMKSVRAFELEEDGVVPEHATVHGEVRSRAWVFHTAVLSATYTDHAGQQHTTRTSFLLIDPSPRTRGPAELRYDPQHPERAAFSWEVDFAGPRLLVMLLGAAALLAAGVSTILLSRARRREAHAIRETIHAGGHEVLLRVLEERPNLVRGEHVTTTYVLELPEGGTLEKTRRLRDAPFWIDIPKRLLLGLRHPQDPTQVMLLDADLAPLEVDPTEVDRLRTRYAAQRHGPSEAPSKT